MIYPTTLLTKNNKPNVKNLNGNYTESLECPKSKGAMDPKLLINLI